MNDDDQQTSLLDDSLDAVADEPDGGCESRGEQAAGLYRQFTGFQPVVAFLRADHLARAIAAEILSAYGDRPVEVIDQSRAGGAYPCEARVRARGRPRGELGTIRLRNAHDAADHPARHGKRSFSMTSMPPRASAPLCAAATVRRISSSTFPIARRV
jgi:hypothetical protein